MPSLNNYGLINSKLNNCQLFCLLFPFLIIKIALLDLNPDTTLTTKQHFDETQLCWSISRFS